MRTIYILLLAGSFLTYSGVCLGEPEVVLVANGTIVTPVKLEPPVGVIPEQPNYVVFLTDDQRWDSLFAMPILKQKLIDRGVEFTNAFATNPECCPFRASLISGGFHTHNTSVMTNGSLNGSQRRFNEDNTIATRLDQAGYKTGFIGRYMHGYQAGHVPAGWDFIAANAYYAYDSYHHLRAVTFYEDGEISYADVNQYVTDFHRDQAIRFIDGAGDDPFFLLVGFFAPHTPFFPDTEDVGRFDHYELPAQPSFDEDVSDKPEWVRDAAMAYANSPGLQHLCEDNAPKRILELLLSVDRAIGEVVDHVESIGKLDDTVFIFTSDNGLTLGEHGIPCDKGMAYEESIRVPFIVRMPGVAARREDAMVAANLDIGTTIFDHVGIAAQTDGRSLMGLLQDPDSPWRQDLYIENFGYLSWRYPHFPVWAGVRSHRNESTWKFVEHGSGEMELYNLITDPFETESLHEDPGYIDLMFDLANKVNQRKGIAIIENTAPTGTVGQSYTFAPRVWGGTPPYEWSIVDGTLPDGLEITSFGVITGSPAASSSTMITLEVQGQRTLTHKEERESFRRKFVLEFTP